MKGSPHIDAPRIPRKDHPAIATAAVITIPAVESEWHVIDRIDWSYDLAPTGGLLTIAVNGVTKWAESITAAGPGSFDFSAMGGWADENAVGLAVVITLASGGAAVTGKLNAVTH